MTNLFSDSKNRPRNPIKIDNIPFSATRDFYFFLMELTWPRLFLLILACFFMINIIFGSLFFIDPLALSTNDKSWWNHFFFSVQTFSTIGYGTISPISFYANILVSIEAALGLISSAMITGIVFAKFSRPKARILFSKPLLINNHNSKRVLSLRVGNSRANDLVDTNLTITVLIEEKSEEGVYLRRMKDLKLERSRSPFFSLSWTIFHIIDETSPLYNLIDTRADSSVIAFTALLIGHDGTYSQTIYGKHTYYPDDLIYDKYFVDVIEIKPDGSLIIDYNKFHQVQ